MVKSWSMVKTVNEYTFKAKLLLGYMGTTDTILKTVVCGVLFLKDHIVGKPLFIWFSTKEGSMSKGINWNRIFKSAS